MESKELEQLITGISLSLLESQRRLHEKSLKQYLSYFEKDEDSSDLKTRDVTLPLLNGKNVNVPIISLLNHNHLSIKEIQVNINFNFNIKESSIELSNLKTKKNKDELSESETEQCSISITYHEKGNTVRTSHVKHLSELFHHDFCKS